MNVLRIPKPRFDLEQHDDGTVTCLPVRLSRSNLMNVTPVGESERVYLDTVTGVKHRSRDYYNQMMSEREASRQN